MTMMQMWSGMAPRARTGLAAGVVAIVALVAALGFWAYRSDYQVLFSEVAAADAAAMTAELDKQKTPYQLADGGSTILVPKDLVYKTRLKLMGKEMPLHGAVGFEVFNNADFGMTEFVQKVNYQRAIQGELTRTILSIEEIQAARVHLALPEQGLFRKSGTKPKASVTVTMKQGHALAPEQVTGIQRLVAASVPDIVAADVTVLNQQGVALTRVAAEQGGEQLSIAQLDLKRGTEDYLAKKVSQVLDRTFGAGEAVASVDVLLNLDQTKVTTEEVLPARGAAGAAAGVMVRERQTSREGAPAVASGQPAGSGSTLTEADYQVGRRVEQHVPGSGAIRRMTIAVVVRQPLRAEQQEKLKEVVMAATGFSAARGDAVVVHTMEQLLTPAQAAGNAAPDAQGALAGSAAASAASRASAEAAAATGSVPWALTAVLAVIVAAVAVAYALRAGRRQAPAARLDPATRQLLLQDIRSWIAAPATAVAKEHKP
ncbi:MULTISPECIES: flagellar basal-body MS-ring/collar protein FliF [unclassified Duganella]|uniref:flagellar basal-body MS-ring/collar protein FliF n=1 Tax=unclassified Duganella TaxID=2636909 RepID=UPI00070BDF48|nr:MULTISPECIES: flagellar basal-body MS-ring/collar protein FliF [unclassified Duganella]KRB99158.1 hypothetical protein ASE26_24695 [Duganella sp. Root198D2]